jgi:hypothetical protein
VRQVNGVKTIGQAKAAVIAARAAASLGREAAGRDLPTGLSGAFAGTGSAAKTIATLDNAVERMNSNARLLGGTDRQGVGPSWKLVAPKVTGVYEVLFDIYDRSGRPPAYLDGLVADLGRSVERYGDTLQGKGLLERAGTILGDVAREGGKGAGAIGAGAGDAAKFALGPLLKSIWKPLLVVGVLALAGGAVYVFTLSKVRP